jgi:hypothetical protein
MRVSMVGNQNSRKHLLSRETLIQLYEIERLPIAEIKRRTGGGSVHRELVRQGIPRRTTRSARFTPTIEFSHADMAYAAGLFDGEGSINIKTPGTSSRTTGFSLVIQVTQTNLAPLLWLQERWGGSVSPIKRRKPTWAWNAGSRLAEKFLLDVLAFLIVKREQAMIAVEFQARRCNTGRRHDPDRLLLEAASRDALHALR